MVTKREILVILAGFFSLLCACDLFVDSVVWVAENGYLSGR